MNRAMDASDDVALLASIGSSERSLRSARRTARISAVALGTLGIGVIALSNHLPGKRASLSPEVVGHQALRHPLQTSESQEQLEVLVEFAESMPPPPTAMYQFRKKHKQRVRSILTCPIAEDAVPPGVPQPSPGCYKVAQDRASWIDGLDRHSIVVDEPGLGKVNRSYLISVPKSAATAQVTHPAPLSFWFHGQYGSASDEAHGWAEMSGYRACADSGGYISVYPDGIGFHEDMKVAGNISKDGVASYDMGTGWNVGTAGNDHACLTERDRVGPLQPVPATAYSCYPSCLKLAKCGKCNWSTCIDDVAFVKAMIAHLSETYCVDMTRLYLGGQSNGGMFTHYISQRMPNTFAAFNPMYGLPLLGYLTGGDAELVRWRDDLRDSAIIEFHDRQDRTIPMDGGPAPSATWTWYYEPLYHIINVWAGIHKCSPIAVDITKTARNICPLHDTVQCFEHLDCQTSRRVVYCLYDGHHGDIPKKEAFGCMSLWFFGQFRRTTPLSAL